MKDENKEKFTAPEIVSYAREELEPRVLQTQLLS